MKKLVIFILLLLLGAAGSVWAGNDWKDNNITTDWFTATNWTMEYVPISTDGLEVILYRTGQAPGPVLLSGQNAVAYKAQVSGAKNWIGQDSSHPIQTLTVQSGASLTTTDYLYVGGNGTSVRWGDLINAGTINVGSNFFVGCGGLGDSGSDLRGWLHMTGGTINVGQTFSIARARNASGFAYLWGGTISTQWFGMLEGKPTGVPGTGTALLDIMNDGKLIVNGDITGTLATYCTTNGWITGYGDKNNVRWDTTTNPGKTTVWAVSSAKATSPSPANGATNVAKTTTLSWTAGIGDVSHDVYFGTTSPGTFQSNQTATTFDPGVLDFNTTYYWRIDEVNGPNTVTGDVWSFTTVSGQAKNPDPATGAMNVALDKVLHWTAGPGAVSHDVYFGTALNDVNSAERLLGDINGDGIVDFNDVSLLSQAWLTNPTGSEPYAGIDDDDIVDFLDYALLSQDWMNNAGPIFKGNQLATNYDPLGLLALGITYYWRIDEVNGCDTVKGNVWSFTAQTGKAFSPSPANAASNVDTTATLSWSAGFGATSHDVYFGTTYPPAFQYNQSGTTFDPCALAQNTTYYWRIDEVGSLGTVQGDDWSFTTRGPALMRKGPYLIYPGNNTQMTVLWQMDATDTDCSIVWGTDTTYATGSVAATEYGTDHQYRGILNGLTPGTKYYYRLTMGGGQYTGSFLAALPADANSVKFLMYGDTRTNPTWNDSVCARMIATYTTDPNYQTICLHAGDWVSSDSESIETSEWWTYSYTNLMTAIRTMPFAGCAGNHEGSTAAVWSKYWAFPFVGAHYFSFDYGPVHITVLDQYTAYTDPSAQYSWLVNDLSASTKPWKIIVLHQPGWSAWGSGTHANDTTVQGVIQPLCLTYGVQIVLAGHNHFYSRCTVDGVQHVTNGAGGAPFYNIDDTKPYVVTVTGNTLAVCKVEIVGDTLTCNTVKASDGTVIDTFTLTH